MSSAGGGGGSGGGILRGGGGGGGGGMKRRPAMEVTFGGDDSADSAHAIARRPTRPSPSDQEDNEDGPPPAADGLLLRAQIDAAKRQRRRKFAGGDLADRAEEIGRILVENDDDDDDDDDDDGSKMGPPGGGGGGVVTSIGDHGTKNKEFRGEEELDNGLSLISPAARAGGDPNYPNAAVSGAYDAGSNAVCPVEPFNLKAEREGGEGYFDGDTYVFRRTTTEDGGRAIDEEPDAWLDELGGRDSTGGGAGAGVIRSMVGRPIQSSSAKAKNNTNTNKRPALDLDDVPYEDLCRRIAALLAGDAETVAKALARYGNVLARNRTRKKKAQRRRRQEQQQEQQQPVKNAGASDGAMTKDHADVAAAHEALAELTDLADALLMGGDGEVYSRTKGELMRLSSAGNAADGGGGEHADGHKRKRNYFGGNNEAGYSKMIKADNAAGDAPVPAHVQSPPVRWEYRGNEDKQIPGPFTTAQMLEWIQGGYFLGAAAVDVRRVAPPDGGGGSSGGCVIKPAGADDLMADLMEDSDEEDGGGDGGEWLRSDEINFQLYT